MSNTMLNQSTPAQQSATEQTEAQSETNGQSAANSSVADRATLARGLSPAFRRLTAPVFEGADPPNERTFESNVYQTIADTHEAVAPLVSALNEGGFEALARAANRADQIYQVDVPLAARLAEAATDLTQGGDLSFNTTELIGVFARLSRHAKRWLRQSEQVGPFVTTRLSTYVEGSTIHSHAIELADLSWQQMTQMDVVRPIAERRRNGVQALLTLIQTGRFPRTPTDSAAAPAQEGQAQEGQAAEGAEGEGAEDDGAAEAERIREAAAALTTQIENALGPAPEAGGDLAEQRAARATEGRLSQADYRDLLQTIQSAEPAVREVVYANAALMDRLQSSASVHQVGGLMRALDSVQAIYDECMRHRRSGGASRQGEAPPKPPFELISTFLRQRPGEANRDARNRILAHTRLKDDFIDVLPSAQNQLIYRLVVRGTDEPTPVDQVHEAVRTNNGAMAARALMELSSTDPEALAGLEADQIFRNSISQLTDEVDVGGAMVRPYHLCLSLWGRVPGASDDPGRLNGPVVDNPAGDTRPLNLEERNKLRSELYDRSARSLREELDDFWGVNDSVISTRLRAFGNRAAREEYVELIRRDGVPQGQRLCESYNRLFGANLRSDIRNGVDDEGRREADRILDISVDSASVGTVEGQVARAGDRREQNVSLDQAMGEVTTDGGTVASVAFHQIVTDLHDELSEWAINGGAELSDYRSIVNRVPRLWRDIGPKLKEATGMQQLHWGELLSNAYAEVGGSLSAEIAEEWSGSERATALRLAGIHPDQVQDRADRAAEANRDPNDVLREQADDLYGDRAQALFSKLSTLHRRSQDSELEEARTLQADYRLARQIDRGALPNNETTPLRPMSSDQDISTAAGYYRAKFGIDLGEHARRVARGMIPERPREGERSAAQTCQLLGVDEEAVNAPIAAPAEDELVIDERNRTQVRPGFTTQIATNNARDMWRILHGRGEIHLINAVLYGPYTDEEQRLIRIAFRTFSGGIDYQFYLQEAVERRRRMASGVTHTSMNVEGTAEGQEAVSDVRRPQGMPADRILVDVDTTELATALEVATTGEINNTTRLRAAAGNGDVDQIFRIVEELDDAGCRQVLGDQALMQSLQSATGGVAWDRVYRILTGQATLADRLVSRSEGADGFWQFLDATDEEGMRDDIKAYIRMLRRRHERTVREEIPDPQAATVEVNRRVRADCLTLLSNADVGAIIEDELSGFERSQADSIMYGNGEESRTAQVLRDGDLTDPEDEIIESIRQMPQEERERMRNDPEYIRRLGDLCDTEEQFRDAMNALMREGPSNAEGGGTDHLAALDEASRGPHEVRDDMSRDETAILDNLAELSEDEYRQLLADPRLRAQILAGLDDNPDERELARQMMAFRFGDASAELGVDVAGPDQTPADGALSREEGEELAYLKFNAVMRIRAITSEGRSWDRMLRTAVDVYKLGFEGSSGGRPAPATDETQATAEAAQAPSARGEHASRARLGVWRDVSAQVQNWAHAELDGGADDRTTKIGIIRQAVLHEADPSQHRLDENVGGWDDDDDILETLRNASDEIIVNQWSSVINNPALGGPSMKTVYDEYVTAKQAAEDSARAEVEPEAAAAIDSGSEVEEEQGSEEPAIGQEDREAAMASMRESGATSRPMPPVGTDLSSKQLAFMNYVVDISSGFESTLFEHAGSWLHLDSGENTSTTRRDNKQWHEWADVIRDRIPRLPDNLVGQALGIAPDNPDYGLITNPNRTALTRSNRRLNQYLRQRGSQHANTRFASDEAENLDVAMTRYGRALGETQIGETPEGYGVISEHEGTELEENYGREVDRAVGDFKAAKAAIAQWAAIIVGVLVTAIITILTAGIATGPAAAIMMSAVTAAMSATASAATQEAIMQGDYDFSGEGLESVAQAAVTGIITAGATYYAQVITRNLAGLGDDAAAMTQMMRGAQPPGWQAIAGEVGEELISESITGLAESGLEYLDPTIWLEGWDEGVRRGNAAAEQRLSAMPKMYLQAALTSMVLSGSHRILPRGNNPLAENIEDNLTGRVNVRQNFRAFFGDQTDVMLEAFTSYAIQAGLEGDINLEDVPGDLVRAYLDEMKEQALDMHVGTAHAGVLRRRVQADVTANRDQLTDEELEDYLAMNQLTLDQQNLAFGGDEEGARLQISVTDYIRLRETSARAAAAAFTERTGQELTADQIAEFVMFVRRARSTEEFRQRLSTSPLEISGGPAVANPEAEEIAESAVTAVEQESTEQEDVSQEEVDATLNTPETQSPENEREFIGSGSFADVYRDGDQVVKEIRPEVGRASERFALSEDDRVQLAEHQAEFTNDLAELEGSMIPHLTVVGPGQLSQEFTEGVTIDVLRGQNFEAFERASATIEHLIGTAHAHWDLPVGGTGELEGGWRVQIDDNRENFRFDENGNLIGWIDPIAVWPPRDRMVAQSTDEEATTEAPPPPSEADANTVGQQMANEIESMVPPAETQALAETEAEVETEVETEIETETTETEQDVQVESEVDAGQVRRVSESEHETLMTIEATVETLSRENLEYDEASKLERAEAEAELARLVASLELDSMSDAERALRFAELSQAAKNFVRVRQDTGRRLEFQDESEDHGRLEVHNHFMGLVEPDVFADRVAAHESRDPENAGKSSMEMTLDAIASFEGSGMDHTRNDEGEVVGRGISGDAIAIVVQAQKDIEAIRRRAKKRPQANDAAQIERIAADAVRKALVATPETDFNSSYEIRDELIKKYFGKDNRAEDENDVPVLHPDMHEVKRSEVREARKGAEKARKSPDEAAAVLPAYADYTREAIRVLLKEGQLYSEQSQSLNKLLRSFPAEMLQRIIDEELDPKTIIANMKAGLYSEEEASRLLRERPLILRNLAMIPTALFAPTDQEGIDQFEERAGKKDPRRRGMLTDEEAQLLESEDERLREQMNTDEGEVVEPEALRQHGDEFIREQEGLGLFQQLDRGDTTGIDIAGLEEFDFTAGGRARFRALYRKLSEVSEDKGEVVVLRPHVGEGSLDLEDTGQGHGIGNAARQGERAGAESAELSHYERARQNVEKLIASLEELEAMGELDTSKVEVRFGHSTHATPDQIARLQALGVIAEVNLESNIQTHSLDPTNPETGRVEEGRFDDHALLSLIYYQVNLILSTDAHSVMSTDLAKEYAKAHTLIEAFLHGQLPLRLRPQEAGERGREIMMGEEEVRELFVGDLTDEELKQFTGAYETIMSFADEYREGAIARERRLRGEDDGSAGPDGGGPAPITDGPQSSSEELADINQTIRERYADELSEEELVGPTDDSAPRLTTTDDDALIGLPSDVVGAEGDSQAAIEALQENGIPRYDALTPEERQHEEGFISEVEANIPAAVEAIYALASASDPSSPVFEVDAAKRLYSQYGEGKKAQSKDETHVRLTANHAMHPTAVAVTRLAFLKRLDELAGLAEDDPRRKIFVTNGGCAAGKGSLTGLVEESTGSFEFGATWDAAGEGDAQENGWILSAAQARGLQVTFGFVENDPAVQYESVLGRAESKGRIVDPVTFARSYVNGQRNFRAFLESPEYQAAVAAGTATAFGMFTGRFNKKSLTDDNESPYPEMRLLGEEGRISSSDDLAQPADMTEAIESALRLFDEWRAEAEGENKDVGDYFVGAIVNTLKFGRPEEAVYDETAATETSQEAESQTESAEERAEGTELAQELEVIAAAGLELAVPMPPAASLSNKETRVWYHQQLEKIPELIDQSLPLRERAIQAFEMRNAIKLAARTLMVDQEAAAKLPPPRTLANVVMRSLDRGIEGDAMWARILAGSQKSNADVDKKLGLK